MESPTEHILDTDRHLCLGGDTDLTAEIDGGRCEGLSQASVPLQEPHQVGDAAAVPPGQMLLIARSEWNCNPRIAAADLWLRAAAWYRYGSSETVADPRSWRRSSEMTFSTTEIGNTSVGRELSSSERDQPGR